MSPHREEQLQRVFRNFLSGVPVRLNWVDRIPLTAQGKLVQVAFPGIFPNLTRYQAEADQARVNQGKNTWKNDAAQVAKALAVESFKWTRTVTTKVLSGGGPQDVYATVQVQEPPVTGGPKLSPTAYVTLSRLEGNDLCVFGNRQLPDWPVHFFFDLLQQPRHRKLRLIAVAPVRFPIAGNELHRHPAKHVIDDRGGVADFRIFREARRLEALMGEFLH